MRALISYEHLSPAQVSALRQACDRFGAAGHTLLPVEFFGGLPVYGWTLADARRPDSWQCLFPDRTTAPRWLVFRRLAQLIARHDIDVVVFNGWFEPVSWWLALTKRALGVRLVLVADSTEIDGPRRAPVEALKRLFVRRVDAAFTAGTRQVAYLERLGLPRTRTATGCDVVDNARFGSIARNAGTEAGVTECWSTGTEAGAECWSTGTEAGATGKVVRTVIATAARLVPVKNLQAALEAFAEVARRHEALTWRLAGQGPLADTLRARARELQAPAEFDGFVSYDRMPDFYAGADVYWQPSLSEPWGLTINEAAAAGLPILASNRCGSADDLVTSANGWLHEPSIDGMVRALETALTDRARWPAMGRRSRAIVAAWDLDRFASGLLDAVTIAAGSALPGAAYATEMRTP